MNCTNRFKTGSGIGFYVFPVNEDKRKAWIRAVSRDKWQPKPSDRLCGAHFVKGRPSKDPNDIDFIPTIFEDKKRRVRVPAVGSMRAERRAKRAKSREEGEDALATADDLIRCTGKEQSAGGDTTSKDTSSQTDPVLLPVDEGYIRKNQKLSAKVVALQEEVDSFHYSYGRYILQLMSGSDNKTKFYTGLPTYAVFKAVFDFLELKMLHARRDSIKDTSKGRKRKLSLMEEFLSVLMRLRLGLVVEDVADRFQISVGTCSRVFHTWIKVIAQEMKVIFPWPSRERVKAAMPKQFAPYPNTRIIIDCTEFFIQRPTSLQSQCETFSHYKHHNTFKVLIGISPGGVITFVSELWGGRVSDQTITESSGLLELLEPGDNIMADRGFDIEDKLTSKGLTINIPPFLGSREQLSSKEVEQTRRIAALRIHVERAIGRMKLYRLIQNVLPISLADLANDIVCTCAYLTNFLPPIISDD